MDFFDSHAHLTSPEVLPHLDPILTRAKIAHIAHVLNICTDKTSLDEGILLSQKHPHIQNAGATTPHDVEKEGELFFPFFQKAAEEKKLVAIGETGLDYHYKHSPIDLQKKFLVQYLKLAAAHNLPVIFHCRDAFDDLFSIVDSEYPREAPAVVHCFTGNLKEAEEVLKRGWYLSLSGIVTFKKSASLREIAKMVPLSQLLIETDTPYLAPERYRGRPNEPAYLPETAHCIASAKNIEVSDLAVATLNNAKRLFFGC